MAMMDVRMEALVCGSDGATLGRVWAMVLVEQGRDTLLAQVLVAGGALERDALLPFALLARSSGQRLELTVTKADALALAATIPVTDGIRMNRADPVWALDGRLGQLRGCYVDEAGTLSDLLVNDEVAHQLGLISVRAIDELAPHRIQLRSRISELGELLRPTQALYQPVELRSEAERASHFAGTH
jgi:hypothetical protein